jgi:hypothetical protein
MGWTQDADHLPGFYKHPAFGRHWEIAPPRPILCKSFICRGEAGASSLRSSQ